MAQKPVFVSKKEHKVRNGNALIFVNQSTRIVNCTKNTLKVPAKEISRSILRLSIALGQQFPYEEVCVVEREPELKNPPEDEHGRIPIQEHWMSQATSQHLRHGTWY